LKLRDCTRAQELGAGDVDGELPKKKHRATVAEWKQAFLADAGSGRSLNEETIRKYRHLFKQLELFAEKKSIRFVEELGVSELTDFRGTWTDAALSSSKKLERLRSIYRFAVDRNWTDTNFALKLKFPRAKDAPTLPFTEEEMKLIFKAAKESERYAADAVYAFILTMRYSGLRISDTTMLARESVNGDRLKLYTAKTGGPSRFCCLDLWSLRSTQSNPKIPSISSGAGIQSWQRLSRYGASD